MLVRETADAAHDPQSSRAYPVANDDKRADLSPSRLDEAFRQASAIVGDDDAIAVLAAGQAFDRDHAAAAATESIFEGIGQKLVYDKSHTTVRC